MARDDDIFSTLSQCQAERETDEVSNQPSEPRATCGEPRAPPAPRAPRAPCEPCERLTPSERTHLPCGSLWLAVAIDSSPPSVRTIARAADRESRDSRRARRGG
eukprot:4249878-Prymnesium_polylepis.1